MLASFATPSTALPAATLEFTTISLVGQQEAGADARALRLQSPARLAEASLQGYGEQLVVKTTNFTAPSIAQVAVQPQRGGSTYPYAKAQLEASASFTDVDVMIVPLGGQVPRIGVRTSSAAVSPAGESQIAEAGHVYSNRPLLHADVSGTLRSASQSVASVRVEGTFALSIWSWNFTVDSSQGERAFVTGTYRQDPVGDPIAGNQLAWTEYQQVAQVEVTDGWIEFHKVGGATTVLYAATTEVEGLGEAAIEGATGLLGSQQAENAHLRVHGEYQMTLSAAELPELTIHQLVGGLDLDGAPIDLGASGPLRDSSATARQTGPSWAWPIGIAAVAAFILVKGPAQVGRFNRIQQRFEEKDYVGVLARIDPFTHRRRFRRKATFLKTISLLSLEEYKEAGLFLQTLGPAEAPEPATKAFLQACAAAGLGQDDAVLQYLSACFRDDPSYIEEARTVPSLAGYLPYFTLTTKEEAAT